MHAQKERAPLLSADKVLGGEVALLPRRMQALGLFEALRNASLSGIRRAAGPDVAERAAREGFEYIHLWVDGRDIPALNDAVYEEVNKIAPWMMARLVPGIFGATAPYYYESTPNVRFHIPFDIASRHRREYAEYAKSRGEGKVTAHGPHRDSWLDCPTNAVNFWTAVGPVDAGNGLSIFPSVYHKELRHRASGEVRDGEWLGQVQNYPMAPGDVLVFHGDQVHASELNSTTKTRHVVSFRFTIGRPRFARAHNHMYTYGPMSSGPLRPFAELPAQIAWSRLRHVVSEGLLRLSGSRIDVRPKQPDSAPAAEPAPPPPDLAVRDDDLLPGQLRPLSAKVCVARLEDGSVVALARRCPHQGGDLSLGTLRDGKVLCPLHNLPIDLRTGLSPCSSLRSVSTYPVHRRGDLWQVDVTPSRDRSETPAETTEPVAT